MSIDITPEKSRWHAKKISQKVKKHLEDKDLLNRLFAIYDCIDLPYSFDFLTYLIIADIERKKLGLKKIDIVIVCHESDPAPCRLSYINKQNFRQYLHNMFLEFTRLLDSIGSILVFDNRTLFEKYYKNVMLDNPIFPPNYDIDCPAELLKQDGPPVHSAINLANDAREGMDLLSLRAPSDQIQLVHKWIKKNVWPKIPVTITLREWDNWDPSRNTNIVEWQKVVDSYVGDNITFVVLRDYSKLFDEPLLKGNSVIYCNEAVLSVSFRSALYQESSLNLFTPNGPLCLGMLNEFVKYLAFGYCSGERSSTAEALETFQGLKWGDNWHGANKYQRLFWDADNFEEIKPKLDSMLNELEEDKCLDPAFYKKLASS